MRKQGISTDFENKKSLHFKFFNSLVVRQSILLITGISLVFLIIFFFSRKHAVDLLYSSTMEQAVQIGNTTINRMDQTFQESMRIAELFASEIGEKSLSDQELKKIMERILKTSHQNRSEILALAVAYEPNTFGVVGEKMLLSSWQEGEIKFINGSNYQNKSWYANTKDSQKGKWQEPFIGDFVTEPIAIYSVPFYETDTNGTKRFAGVVCVDLSISWMQQLIDATRIPNSGYAFLLSQSGRIVVHPNSEWIFVESVFSVADKQNNAPLNKIGKEMVAGKSGTTPFMAADGRKLFACYRPMESTNWSFGILFPEQNLFAKVKNLEESFILLGSLALIMLLFMIIIITIGITRPLKKLAFSAQEIGNGNLNTKIPKYKRNDELGALANSFHSMRDSLILQMKNLQKITADKERIESELKVAQEIQNGILPAILPPFPKCDVFEIAASLIPAKEVGGDLYDFFMLSPNLVCLVIGDVSGKGIPAALFMAVTQTLHRGLAHGGEITPAELVGKMNNALCANNTADMFVTYLFAILDLTTGELTYCNAGHDPFYLLKADGELESPCERHGIPLGVRENRIYRQSTIKLCPGDSLFLYTDGIPEAKNINNEFFDMKRLKNILTQCAKNRLSAKELADTVLNELKSFVGNAEQFDDITFIAFRLIKKNH